MSESPPSRFWVIQHPSTEDVVAKFDTDTDVGFIPDEVANHEDFQISELSDRSSLINQTVDQSGLSDAEKEMLSKVYPI